MELLLPESTRLCGRDLDMDRSEAFRSLSKVAENRLLAREDDLPFSLWRGRATAEELESEG